MKQTSSVSMAEAACLATITGYGGNFLTQKY